MYIAFRWLTALAFAMWLGLCCLDIYLTGYKSRIFQNTTRTHNEIFKYNNVSASKVKKIENESIKWNARQNVKQPGVAVLHYVMFLSGAIAVMIYNKETPLITYWREKVIIAAQFCETYVTSNKFKITAKRVGVAISHYWTILWGTVENYVLKVVKRSENGQNTNLSLLKRLKDLGQDRKALGQLLISAINENRNIRRQYQSEVIERKRLLRYVQDTQKLMKESTSRYVDFQQLYILTEKENCLLKNNIKALRNEKDDAEKKLLELINVIYRSKNNDLKAYCTRFIVHTKKNLLNSDVSAEIEKFLQKSYKPVIRRVADRVGDISLYLENAPNSSRVTEVLENDSNLMCLASSGPKLRGLPGEFVFTVKDKNGIIEKLYEYNYETDRDNGDVIRRIRQYSVYRDKDCLLDQTNLIRNIPTYPSLSASATRIRLDIKTLSNHGFLTKVSLNNNLLRMPPTPETRPLP